MKRNWSGLACLVAILCFLTACSEIDYCAQCVSGQIDVMSRRRPITEVLKDPSVPETERKQLAKVLEIRSFAVDKLGLPDNDSYRLYANINRPYVVWNVVATPEFSMTPKQWCYPVVGCVAYRGYFDAESAKATGVALAEQGYDVDVYGVKAYSTLRWFNDPVLNTFIDGTDSQLASLIFHELAHQVIYVPDDTSFNEAFAKTVESEGLHRWLLGNANDQEWQAYLDRERRSKEFVDMLRQAREQLLCLYAQPMQDAEKRAEKHKILAELEETLRNRQKQWPNPKAIDGWLARGLNNARLASIATYEEKVPAFQALLASKNGDLTAFYGEVNRLAKLPAKERAARLTEFSKATEVACKIR
jgi:predicted aminopeptidase